MIYSLTGELQDVFPLSNSVVINCGGVGYLVNVTTQTMSTLPAPTPGGTYEGKSVRIFTYLQVREDGVELFGFATPQELDCFKLLITVSGFGPKAGMSVLSQFTPEKLALAIAAEDTKAISRAPGIGAKMAARLVLELKEKMAKAYPSVSGNTTVTAKPASSPVFSSKLTDAQDALLVLGYSRPEVTSVLKSADLSQSVDQIIREALTKLLKN